ncbi:MAG: hypothetical protein KUA35_04885, partial [Pseudodesulfovibrio sp.]|uniref:hypothetical protein n=1 Tax=Pseudodesulfovibrio TaxID=2035811 RepID=UPI001D5A749D
NVEENSAQLCETRVYENQHEEKAQNGWLGQLVSYQGADWKLDAVALARMECVLPEHKNPREVIRTGFAFKVVLG